MAGGTMKTLYWLVATAAVAAAGVTVYTRLTAGDPPLPKVPTVADTPHDVPQIPLPPVVMPPDEPLAMPPAPDTPAWRAGCRLPNSIKADTSPMPLGPSVPVPTIPTVAPDDVGASGAGVCEDSAAAAANNNAAIGADGGSATAEAHRARHCRSISHAAEADRAARFRR